MGFIEFINRVDFAILDFINNHLHVGILDKILPAVSRLADKGLFWIFLAIMFLFDKSTRKTAIKMGIALALGLAIGNGLLKNIVQRVRPYDVNTSVNLLIERLSDWSFPSGHTLASFEAAGVLMICERKRFGIIALVYAILIAFSRLYLYVHYPTDVLASVVLGLLFAFIACKAVDLVAGLFEKRSRNKSKA